MNFRYLSSVILIFPFSFRPVLDLVATRRPALDKQRASESGNSIALKSRVSEGSPGFDEKTTDKADQLYEDLKGKLKVVEGEDNL